MKIEHPGEGQFAGRNPCPFVLQIQVWTICALDYYFLCCRCSGQQFAQLVHNCFPGLKSGSSYYHKDQLWLPNMECPSISSATQWQSMDNRIIPKTDLLLRGTWRQTRCPFQATELGQVGMDWLGGYFIQYLAINSRHWCLKVSSDVLLIILSGSLFQSVHVLGKNEYLKASVLQNICCSCWLLLIVDRRDLATVGGVNDEGIAECPSCICFMRASLATVCQCSSRSHPNRWSCL